MRHAQQTSIRLALAQHTRPAHEDLHHHHWIGRLMSSTLTTKQYYCILSAYLQFYRHIESERSHLGDFDQFNLRDAVTLLESDVATAQEVNGLTSAQNITFNSASSALGALYVLHGARFGAAILNKQVARTLPDVPRGFLQNTTPRQQWRELTAAIETLASDDKARKDLFSTADLTFSAFGKSVTQYCESAFARPVH